MPASAVIQALAHSLLAGEPTVEAAHARLVRTLGRPWRWLRPLVARYVAAFARKTRPRHRDVVHFLQNDVGFRRAWGKCLHELSVRSFFAPERFVRVARGITSAPLRHELSVAEWLAEPPTMQPVPAAQHWDLPPIETVGDLAAWLSLNPDELEWFADLKALGNKLAIPKLQHYHYAIRSKRSGGVRLIEMPKPRLKELQRRILTGILDRVPVHPAVHGFVKSRSIVSFAAPHAGKAVVLRLDLQDFFPGFPAARVQALFRTLGYPEPVADLLGGICTNAVPRSAWHVRPLEIAASAWREARTLYARPHLPQGAPTSPALANLMTYRLDCRLSGLAKTAGAAYTRYADDLAFSGGEDFRRAVDRFSAHAAAVALEEGFRVNHHKTRIMRQGVRQQLAGVVVNHQPTPSRRDLKLLEAILTNCVRHGPASQNRDAPPNFRAHLEGRVGFVQMVNREKGRRLKALLDAIQWA